MSRREKINEVLRSVSKAGGAVDEDESLFDTGRLDSFTLVDLVSGLEQAFGVKVPDGDATPRKFDTIAKIDAYLENHGA